METKVIIEVSNRHIHLSEETYNKLFDEPINKVKDLSQKGMYVSDKVVTIYSDSFEFKNIKLIGPLRSYDQVEISHNDALKLHIDPPVRASGDLNGASIIHVKTDKADLELACAIISQRHIHMSPDDAHKYGVVNGQKVKVKVAGDKSGEMDAFIKVSEDGVYYMHIDTDDANAFLIKNLDEGTLII